MVEDDVHNIRANPSAPTAIDLAVHPAFGVSVVDE
jgi:hypothetical protein